MKVTNSADAFDLLAHAAQYEERLVAAMSDLAELSGLERERAWLNDAQALVQKASGSFPKVLEACAFLPELSRAREELAERAQGEWVDTLEKLQAGITYHSGSRAPILETLYPKQKLPSLRRASVETVRAYHDDFHRRLKGSYVQRMLQSEEFAFAHPILDAENTCYERWQGLLEGAVPPVEEQERQRALLLDEANDIGPLLQQARLLAEAALLSQEGLFERHALGARAKKRAIRLVEEPASAPLELSSTG